MKRNFALLLLFTVIFSIIQLPGRAIYTKDIEDFYWEDTRLAGVPYNCDRVLIKIRDFNNNSARGYSMYDFNKNSSNELTVLVGLLNPYGVVGLVSLISVNDIERKEFKPFGCFDFDNQDSYTWYIGYIKNGMNVIDIIDELLKDDIVITAEPDYILETQSIGLPDFTTDPGLVNQWHIEQLGIRDAWEYLHHLGFTAGGRRDVVVAVIDTGVDYTHSDLKDNMWVNKIEVNGNGLDDDGNGYIDDVYGINVITGKGDIGDKDGHGTHVAGIIAAVANNNIGGVGVAFNVQIMAIKATDSNEFSASNIAKGIRYATDMGAHVINMSFGAGIRSRIIADALESAKDTCVLVASAGNESIHNEPRSFPRGMPIYPAAYPWVIGVMAQRQKPSANGDCLAKFSNWDLISQNDYEYELMVPGVNIYSTFLNNGYAKWSGTSMAAPIVSGIAALICSIYPDTKNYSTEFIMERLESTGILKQGITYSDTKPAMFYKEVNAYNALIHGTAEAALIQIIALISTLPEVEQITLEHTSLIESVRELLEQKKSVFNISTEEISNINSLIAAELKIDELKIELSIALEIAEVAIGNLPLEVTLDVEYMVIEARELVNIVFTLDKNAKVKGMQILEAAEFKINELKSISTLIYGDLNDDGYITNMDYILLRRYISGINIGYFNHAAADINQDGSINNIDLIVLRRYIAGIPF